MTLPEKSDELKRLYVIGGAAAPPRIPTDSYRPAAKARDDQDNGRDRGPGLPQLLYDDAPRTRFSKKGRLTLLKEGDNLTPRRKVAKIFKV